MKFSTKITWFAAIPALLYVVCTHHQYWIVNPDTARF
jgi:hypothetical protein